MQSYTFAITLMVVVLVLDWTAGLSLVARTTELAQSGYGALLASLSILAGGAAFVLLARATVRYVRKRRPVQASFHASVGA